jgi:signal recognition particle subunit SRP19
MKFKTFSAIYPNYLDAEKTVKLGRRIAAKDAVPEPTMQDIHEALVRLDIRHVIQPHKGYSRDASSRWDNPGRVLVDLDGATQNGVLDMSPDGAYDMDDAIPEMDGSDDSQIKEKGEGRGKKLLLRKLALVISGLPNRQKRLEVKSKILEEEKLKAAKEEKVGTKSGIATSGAGGNRKKKGKKKK